MNYRNNGGRGDRGGRQRPYHWAPCKDLGHSPKKTLKTFGGEVEEWQISIWISLWLQCGERIGWGLGTCGGRWPHCFSSCHPYSQDPQSRLWLSLAFQQKTPWLLFPYNAPSVWLLDLPFHFSQQKRSQWFFIVRKIKFIFLSWSINPFNPGHVSLSSVISNHLSLSTLCLSP